MGLEKIGERKKIHLTLQPSEFHISIPKNTADSKMLVTCQRFGDLLLFGLIRQYSSNHKTYNQSSFKVIATYLQQ